MAQGEKRVVWVLGAGFSVPLGGPLFRDLISQRTLGTLLSWEHYVGQTRRLTKQSDPVHAGVLSSIVCSLYEAGLKARLWDDAEQFLERLEIADSDPQAILSKEIRACFRSLRTIGALETDVKDVIEAFHLNLPEVLHVEAVRFVAGACTAFLLRAHDNPKVVDESEQWDPYRRWYAYLQPGDSVISFNYDGVPNLLAEHGRRQRPARDKFVSPIDHPVDMIQLGASSVVPLFQLHGQVSWKRLPNGKVDLEAGRLSPHGSMAYIHPEIAVIGVPGQTKLSFPAGLLKCLWDPAMGAIAAADAIVFVGYRFPETDNLAKRALIEALKKNPGAYAHVVLGSNNPDTARVQSLLQWTRPREKVRVHPLWAQDFLAVYERNGLFNG